jgi:hypothetical protein
LWKIDDNQYYIDCPASAADLLLNHLNHKLRRTKVSIEDQTDEITSHVVRTLNAQSTKPAILAAMDPRHPSSNVGLWDCHHHQTPVVMMMSKKEYQTQTQMTLPVHHRNNRYLVLPIATPTAKMMSQTPPAHELNRRLPAWRRSK